MNLVELICGEISLKKNRTFVQSNILYAVPIKSILKKNVQMGRQVSLFSEWNFIFIIPVICPSYLKKKPLLVFKRVCQRWYWMAPTRMPLIKDWNRKLKYQSLSTWWNKIRDKISGKYVKNSRRSCYISRPSTNIFWRRETTGGNPFLETWWILIVYMVL